MTVPEGTSRVSMFGAVGIDHGRFSVSFTPAVYGQKAFLYDAWCRYSVQNIPTFDAVTDPNVSYHMQLTNLGPKNSSESAAYLEVSHFEFYQSKLRTTSESGRLSNGAIVGIAVGGVASLIVAALVAWAVYRHCHPRLHQEVDLGSDADDAVDHIIEPFQDPTPRGSTGPGAALGVAHPDTPTPKSDKSLPAAANSTGPSDLKSCSRSLAPLTVQNPDASASVAAVTVSAANGSSTAIIKQVQHIDGGTMPQSAAVIIEETPPVYNPDWTRAGSAGAGESASSDINTAGELSETAEPGSSAS